MCILIAFVTSIAPAASAGSRDKANVDETEERKRAGPVKKIQWTQEAAAAEKAAAEAAAKAAALAAAAGVDDDWEAAPAAAGNFQPDPYNGHMTYQEVNKALTTLRIWYRIAEDNEVSHQWVLVDRKRSRS